MQVTGGAWVEPVKRMLLRQSVKPRWWLVEWEADRWHPPFSRGWWELTRTAWSVPVYVFLCGLGVWTKQEGCTWSSGHWTLGKPQWRYLRRTFGSIRWWAHDLWRTG